MSELAVAEQVVPALIKDEVVAGKKKTLNMLLEDMKPQFAMVLPKHLTAERICRIAVTQWRTNKDLGNCDFDSFLSAIMTAAQLGLEPDGVLGHGYLVAYSKKGEGLKQVQFIPGYKGLLALARNSGEVSSISAHEVCEKDEFDFAFGLEEKLVHKPARGDRGKVTNFYAIAKFKDGGHHMDVMTVEEVEALRNKSSGYKAFKAGFTKSAIWDEHFIEMGRKTAIRRIAKYLPLNVQRAAVIDSMYDAGRNAQIDKYGDFIIEGESKETQEPKQVESKPRNMDEFIAKVSTPAHEPLARQEQPIGKEEPVIVKPDQKPSAPNIQVWIKINKDIKAAINAAKTSDDVNKLINLTHKVTLSDMQKSQPDFYNEIMDYAMDKQASFHERGTKLSQTDLLNNN